MCWFGFSNMRHKYQILSRKLKMQLFVPPVWKSRVSPLQSAPLRLVNSVYWMAVNHPPSSMYLLASSSFSTAWQHWGCTCSLMSFTEETPESSWWYVMSLLVVTNLFFFVPLKLILLIQEWEMYQIVSLKGCLVRILHYDS